MIAIGASGRRLRTVILLAVGALLLVACSAGTDPVVVTQTITAGEDGSVAATPTGGTASSPVGSSQASSPARFSASPRFGSTDVAPTDDVSLTAFNATINEVNMTAEAGGVVLAGSVSEDGGTWSLTDRMAYATTYRFTGTATARDGTAVPIDGQLSTIDPGDTMRASFQLAEGGTYGVATPIILTFAGQIADKAAAEQALTVTTDKAVAGSWGWLQDEDIQGTGVKQSRVHYRTKEYWPANTQVTVTANLYGVDLGGGAWGREDLTRSFAIGRSQIVKADVNSFRLVVLVDGAVTKNYPVSYGRATDNPDLETRSGIHVVQEKYDSFTMCNPKYGYCGFVANWAVRISNNGEFIHENAAVVASLGKENVSHGCVNMSPADAKDYYDSALYGDPVEVTGTTPQLGPSDGDIFDWTYDFDTWKAFSAA